MKVELERKDWEDTKDRTKELIRGGILNLKINRIILAMAEREIEKICRMQIIEKEEEKNTQSAID